MSLHVESVHFKADQKLLDFIDKKMEALDKYFGRIIDKDVILKLDGGGQIKDKIAEVKIKVPGDILFASDTQQSFETALEEVTDVLKRQLKKYKEKNRSY